MRSGFTAGVVREAGGPATNVIWFEITVGPAHALTSSSNQARIS